jgi:hypothetical protein
MVHEVSQGAVTVIHEVPAADWCLFLEGISRAHRAWLATIHVVDTGGAVTRRMQVRLKSATHVFDAALFEFMDDGQSFCARHPCALRLQETNIGAVQALEIETLEGQFVRLAFRATALPEQLDGLAPGEVDLDQRARRLARHEMGLQRIRKCLLLLRSASVVVRIAAWSSAYQNSSSP